MRVHKGGLDAVLGQGVREQVVAAAVDGLLSDDMTTVRGEGFDRIGDRRRARSQRQRRAAALQSGDALLQHLLRGVGQSAVDIARVGKTEAVGGVLRITEYIGSGLIDGYRSRIGSGIGGFLSNVKL